MASHFGCPLLPTHAARLRYCPALYVPNLRTVALAVRNLVVANKSYENLNRQLAVFFAHLDIKVVGNAAEFQGDGAREGLAASCP
jgi:hypothetical protein